MFKNILLYYMKCLYYSCQCCKQTFFLWREGGVRCEKIQVNMKKIIQFNSRTSIKKTKLKCYNNQVFTYKNLSRKGVHTPTPLHVDATDTCTHITVK